MTTSAPGKKVSIPIIKPEPVVRQLPAPGREWENPIVIVEQPEKVPVRREENDARTENTKAIT